MQKKITKRSVDEVRAGASDAILWDTEIRGFGLRCRPSGAKYYMLKLRLGGRQRWLTIGQHGSPWTPEGARAKARSLLGHKADGKDPAVDRDRKKGVATVGELGVRFLKEYVPNRCKPKTAQEYGRAVNQHINRVIGHHPVTEK